MLFFTTTTVVGQNNNTATTNSEDDRIFYVSLNKAIHLGQYDGVVPVKQLLEYGDFGLGSIEKLEYELVILNRVAYGIPASGEALRLADSALVPYAAIKAFKAEQSFWIDSTMDFEQLKAHLNEILESNRLSAIKIQGDFSYIEYRSFNKQDKPYRPTDQLEEIKFSTSDIEGTLVGFYTPEAMDVLNSPAYHFHFIDKNRMTGGHLLDIEIVAAEITVDYVNQFEVNLPPSELLDHIQLDKK